MALSRRQASLAALGGAIVGLAGLPSALAASPGVAVPSGPCRLTRRLERSLRDANAVIVTRSWRIDFAWQVRGIAISGEQVSVSVDAPERLAPIAKVEEERSTQGMFPILLAPDGTIVAAGENSAQVSLDTAVEIALDLLGEESAAGAHGQGVAPHAAYLAQLQAAGSSMMDAMPGDLFYPSTTPFRTVRRIELPDGARGEFEVSWEASTQAGSPLLERAGREIITRIGASEKSSSEDWTLEVL